MLSRVWTRGKKERGDNLRTSNPSFSQWSKTRFFSLLKYSGDTKLQLYTHVTSRPLWHTLNSELNRVSYFSSNALIFPLVAQIPMRQLSLHVSALNDLEYSAYTGVLHDLIADDQSPSDDYGNVSVGVREVRAWLRGRYASMPLSDIKDRKSVV